MHPELGERDYWEGRFQKDEKPFDWLEDPTEIIPRLKEVLVVLPNPDVNILHMGSGSSLLSVRLRDLVADPRQIHNVDLSSAAIKVGKNLEAKVYGEDGINPEGGTDGAGMHWSQLDVTSIKDIRTLSSGGDNSPVFSMIVDKSSSDAIACNQNIEINPADFDVQGSMERSDAFEHERRKVHPLWLLTLNMALITLPGASWICISYSEERFPFFEGVYKDLMAKGSIEVGSLHPARYWKLKSKEALVVKGKDSDTLEPTHPVHKPEMKHWLYVLERTENLLRLQLRDGDVEMSG